mgnify:CR=1 FL=1
MRKKKITKVNFPKFLVQENLQQSIIMHLDSNLDIVRELQQKEEFWSILRFPPSHQSYDYVI